MKNRKIGPGFCCRIIESKPLLNTLSFIPHIDIVSKVLEAGIPYYKAPTLLDALIPPGTVTPLS